MQGYIYKIVTTTFGFIKSGESEYFFHRDEYKGHWNSLTAAFRSGEPCVVQFTPENGPKGLRASAVFRIDPLNRTESPKQN